MTFRAVTPGLIVGAIRNAQGQIRYVQGDLCVRFATSDGGPAAADAERVTALWAHASALKAGLVAFLALPPLEQLTLTRSALLREGIVERSSDCAFLIGDADAQTCRRCGRGRLEHHSDALVPIEGVAARRTA